MKHHKFLFSSKGPLITELTLHCCFYYTALQMVHFYYCILELASSWRTYMVFAIGSSSYLCTSLAIHCCLLTRHFTRWLRRRTIILHALIALRNHSNYAFEIHLIENYWHSYGPLRVLLHWIAFLYRAVVSCNFLLRIIDCLGCMSYLERVR